MLNLVLWLVQLNNFRRIERLKNINLFFCLISHQTLWTWVVEGGPFVHRSGHEAKGSPKKSAEIGINYDSCRVLWTKSLPSTTNMQFLYCWGHKCLLIMAITTFLESSKESLSFLFPLHEVESIQMMKVLYMYLLNDGSMKRKSYRGQDFLKLDQLDIRACSLFMTRGVEELTWMAGQKLIPPPKNFGRILGWFMM